MERRRWLATLAGVAGTLAGCSAPLASGAGPSPVVVDHVRGRVTVTETSRTHVLGGGSRIEATVTNAGHPATVDVTLYWVPELGLDPEGVSDLGLRQLGYDREATERLQVGRGAEQTVTFEASPAMPSATTFARTTGPSAPSSRTAATPAVSGPSSSTPPTCPPRQSSPARPSRWRRAPSGRSPS